MEKTNLQHDNFETQTLFTVKWTNEKLRQAILQGGEQGQLALGALLREMKNRFFYPNCPHFIEDVIIDKTFLVWERIDEGSIVVSNIEGYLHASIQNEINYLQKKGKRNVGFNPLEHDKGDTISDLDSLNYLMDVFKEAGLSEKCHRILEESFKGFKGKEIADNIGVSHGHLRNQSAECRRILAEFLFNNPKLLDDLKNFLDGK